jgi:hypothetical protein
MKRDLHRARLAVTALMLLGIISTVCPASATIRYTVTYLGFGYASDINNNGQVVGQT